MAHQAVLVPEGEQLAQNGDSPPFDPDKAASKLKEQAKPASKGVCAKSIKSALRAGGLEVGKGVEAAKDMGPALEKVGFSTVDKSDYAPKKGDVVVIQPYPGGSKDGHIATFDGEKWISDFEQKDMWGGPGYRTNKPPYEIYRPGR